MTKYLRIHHWPDWNKDPIKNWEPNPEPLTCDVLIHKDFKMASAHNVPCQICFNNPAFYHQHMTPGKYAEIFGPCKTCQKEGWVTLRLPLLIRIIFKFFGVIGDE